MVLLVKSLLFFSLSSFSFAHKFFAFLSTRLNIASPSINDKNNTEVSLDTSRSKEGVRNVVIIGSGPSGCTAAIYTGKLSF